jgi:mannitol-1-phosphate 5-dehydrogenase
VVFVDIFKPVIDELNRRRSYDVVIKSNNPDEIIHVENVRGLLISQVEEVVVELTNCDIAAISVGQQGIPHIVPLLGKALIARKKKYGIRPLDIILAENMRNADSFVFELLIKEFPDDFPLNEMAGLIETSIGKMVPIMSKEVQEKDPLLVYAEAYNTLILAQKAFKNPIPDIPGLAPKENIKAWVDRKSYIHNFGHAAAAYTGYLVYPDKICLSEVLEDSIVRSQTREAMLQSAAVLLKKYPGEFTLNDLTEHTNDLLSRFENRSLGDTVYRVGCDLKRKLYRTDRVLSPLLDGIKFNLSVEKIIQIFKSGLNFRGVDELGNMFPGDIGFLNDLEMHGKLYVLENICDLNKDKDAEIIKLLL